MANVVYTSNGEGITYLFNETVHIVKYSFTTYTEGTLPLEWTFEGLIGGQWTVLDTQPNPGNPIPVMSVDTPYEYEVSPIDVTGVRIVITRSSGDSVALKNFQVRDELGQYINHIVPFCTDMSSLTHSGSLNGAQVDSMELRLSRPVPATFYGVSHNILTFENGMASLAW